MTKAVPPSGKENRLTRLAVIRTAIGMTQKDLAARLGTTQQAIARWELGYSEPRLAQLRQLATIMGTSVSELIESGRATEGA